MYLNVQDGSRKIYPLKIPSENSPKTLRIITFNIGLKDGNSGIVSDKGFVANKFIEFFCSKSRKLVEKHREHLTQERLILFIATRTNSQLVFFC